MTLDWWYGLKMTAFVYGIALGATAFIVLPPVVVTMRWDKMVWPTSFVDWWLLFSGTVVLGSIFLVLVYIFAQTPESLK